jgi:hypothetical protein
LNNVGGKKREKRRKKKKVAYGDRKEWTVAWAVAVAGWQWYRWKEGIRAVILISVTMWQWQYWQSCGGFEKSKEKKKENKKEREKK